VTFSHSIGNALVFLLPNDGIDALKESYRTLKPGGTTLDNQVIVNFWAYLQTASEKSRPFGTPFPRMGMLKWASADFLRDVGEKEIIKEGLKKTDGYRALKGLKFVANIAVATK
ncbi:hypothetical protein LAWI1_G004362, partial [Lachnellula willkommii]